MLKLKNIAGLMVEKKLLDSSNTSESCSDYANSVGFNQALSQMGER